MGPVLSAEGEVPGEAHHCPSSSAVGSLAFVQSGGARQLHVSGFTTRTAQDYLTLWEWAYWVAAAEMAFMGQYRVNFLRREKWWVGWADDVPGALTQGKTLDEVRQNLRDAIQLMQETVDLDSLPAAPQAELIREVIEA